MNQNNLGQIVLDNASATGTSTVQIDVRDFKTVVLAVIGGGSANATLKVKGSIVKFSDEIDFTSASSKANPWTYLAIKNYTTGSVQDGATGITVADGVKFYEVNVNALSFMTVEVSAYTAGNVSVFSGIYHNN